jgi:hypothetical protein
LGKYISCRGIAYRGRSFGRLDVEEEEFDFAKIFLVCRDEKRGLKKDAQNV